MAAEQSDHLPFFDLPRDLQGYILHFLGPLGLCLFSSISKQAYKLANQNEFWRPLIPDQSKPLPLESVRSG
jgi:hypothetical protein